MIPNLILAGNLLVDDVVWSDGRTRMAEAGGAVLHAALGAGLFGDGVACLSCCGTDYPQTVLSALEARGIDLLGVRRLLEPGGRTWLLYEGDGGTCRQMVPRLGRPTHEALSPTPQDLPPTWLNAKALHLAPMPLPCQSALVSAVPQTMLVSLDPHTPIAEDTLQQWQPLLERVDILFLGDDEMLLADYAKDKGRCVQRLPAGRLRYVVCKEGPKGGVVFDRVTGEQCRWSPFVAEGTTDVDPTGCGDAFAGGFLTGLLDGLPPPQALLRGVVCASFALSGFGASGLMVATRQEAGTRLALLRRRDILVR